MKSHFSQILGGRLNDTRLKDCLFLSLVVFLSLILYVTNLGFYSDDWYYIARFLTSSDQSILGLFKINYQSLEQMRPIQILCLTLLYKLFSLHPLGYHLTNAVVIMLGILLFYLVLCELNLPRLLALAVPIIYALLPNYSTDRFWIAASQSNLAMAFYFLSLYTDLRAIRSRIKYRWSWKFLSVISLLGSTLAYETFLLLFPVNLLLVIYHRQQLGKVSPTRHVQRITWIFLQGSSLLALALVVLFKKSTAEGLGTSHSFWGQLKYLAKGSIAVNYGTYGLGFPRVVWRILHNYPNAAVFALGGILSILVFWYFYHVASQSQAKLFSRVDMIRFVGLGIIVFGLGYAVFITTSRVSFTATGINNRTANAAAVGVALSLVGLIGLVVASFLRSDLLRKRYFCLLLTLLCTSGFLANNTIALFWESSYRQQKEVLGSFQQYFPALPSKTTVLLDGVCPRIGAAPLFRADWDFAGAIRILYRDPTLQANVVSPILQIRENEIFTKVYDSEYHYPYNSLLVYNASSKVGYLLDKAEDAYHYFQLYPPNRSHDCQSEPW